MEKAAFLRQGVMPRFRKKPTYLLGAGDRNRTGTVFEDRRILSPVRLPVPPLRQEMAPRVGLEPTTYRLTAGCSTVELPWNMSASGNASCPGRLSDPQAEAARLQPEKSFTRRRLTLPGGCPPSTISDERLNFCVRDGNRCGPFSIVTGYD